jgi:flagellar biosynthesis protein FlhA
MNGKLAEKMNFLHRYSDFALAAAVVFILLLLVLPLTDFMLDFIITINLWISVTTLIVTLYSQEVLSFNSFPSFLLFITLFRLGLNIATTRMILTEAHAGYIIKTFGDVVTGGNPFVGFVIFILLSGINFVVITKGSGRVAEVAARFTLDSLPGKQLSIDADVNAGVINESEAKRRREKIITEADFYGAMDGSSKFVRGDAIAGIIIILVNIIGGFVVGMLIKGMDWESVVKIYITLTVGDGLATQIPALLVSVAAGIIVTRSSSKQNLAEAFRTQLFNNPKVLFITSTIILLMGCIPGMPFLVIIPICFILYAYAYALYQIQPSSSEEPAASFETNKKIEESKIRGERIENVLFIDVMELGLGRNLTIFADPKSGGNLVQRIALVRKQIAAEMGFVVPSIRIHDPSYLDPNTYVIKIKGNEVASGILRIESYLAINPGNLSESMDGVETMEPAFGLPALWIPPSQKDIAMKNGYVVVDLITVLVTHLTEIIRTHADELINRQDVSKMLDSAREVAPAVVEEILTYKVSLGQILRVLQNLLREGITIRDFVTILEILADHAMLTTDPDVLSEYVRIGLGRSICKEYQSEDKRIHAITLDPKVELMLIESIQANDFGRSIVIHPSTQMKIIEEIQAYVHDAARMGVQPVVLTTGRLRPVFKRMVERSLPRLPVLSMDEIVTDVATTPLGEVSMEVLMV